MNPCVNCKRRSCPQNCYPFNDYARGQWKLGNKVVKPNNRVRTNRMELQAILSERVVRVEPKN